MDEAGSAPLVELELLEISSLVNQGFEVTWPELESKFQLDQELEP